jgi:hypothetical protein
VDGSVRAWSGVGGRRPGRVALVALGLALVLVSVASPASAQSTANAAPPVVTQRFTPGPPSQGCATFPFEVVQSPGSTPVAFEIRITVARRLCSPVGATAAVYAMPSAATAWPQTLVERQIVTLQEPGVYVVSFAKGCLPQQFDLIAGTAASVTPRVVAPTGPWHGPLLFPFDVNTSLQWRGCGPDPVIPEFPAPALGLGLGAVVVGGAVWWRRHHLATGSVA